MGGTPCADLTTEKYAKIMLRPCVQTHHATQNTALRKVLDCGLFCVQISQLKLLLLLLLLLLPLGF
jgi:hypothetical protein